MEFRSFLIKYGEIGVKGKNRWKFEDVLIKQVKTALRKVDGTFDIVRQHGRIYVDTDGSADYEDTIEALKHVFGLVSICPVVRFENRDYEFVKEQVVRYMKEVYGTQQKTFKVFTRRIDKDYPGTSETISAELGAVILDACPNLTVNVREPEIPLHVEIRNEAVSIYSLTIPGPGGMPVGTNGRAMLLLSGGIDSRRLYDREAGRPDRGDLLPRAALHQRPGKAEGHRPGEAGGEVRGPGEPAHHQLYRDPAGHL